MQIWEFRSNNQRGNLYKKENILQFIKSKGMQWIGHVGRAAEYVIKYIMTWTLAGWRPRRWPRRWWIDSVNKIWKTISQEGGADWQVTAYNREKWEKVVYRRKDSQWIVKPEKNNIYTNDIQMFKKQKMFLD